MTTDEKAAPEVRLRGDVRVLGPCSVALHGKEVSLDRWPKKAGTLLRLLALRHEHRVSRDVAIESLWPDASAEAGLNSLKSLLHRVRRAQGDQAELAPFVLSHGWVTLNPAWTWTVDAAELLDAAGAAGGDIARLERAVSLFRGEPLIEDRYEEWATPVRDRLIRTLRDLCLRLASLYSMHGSLQQSVEALERILALDPLDEEVVSELMGALHRLGRSLEAVRRYEAFAEALGREMELSPSAHTVQLAAQIRSRVEREAQEDITPGISIPSGTFLGARPEAVLIGRKSERERLALSAQSIEDGTGRCLLICGETGVGKTRLAQEAAVLAWDHGYLVATASCTKSTQHLPFHLVYDLLSVAFHGSDVSIRLAASREWPFLLSLLRENEESATEAWEAAEYESLLLRTAVGALSLMSQHRPLAILIDDIQEADEGSLRFLNYLVRHTRDRAVFVLATCAYDALPSDHALGHLIRQLERPGLVERTGLQRLSREETEELVASIIDEPPPMPEFLEFVYSRTKGNPFFVRRLLESLGGHYRLRRQIGAGGTGQVFEAEDLDTTQRVAVKIMFARTEADASAMLQFQREALVLSRLAHPNIVTILDSFVDEHTGFLVTELIHGESLQSTIRRERLSLARVQAIVQQVIDAVECAHRRGIVHHDLKPGNILISTHDHVTVTDFGVAALLRPSSDPSLTTTAMRMTTPLYMAPEQIEGKRVDVRSDLYSLGAVLYEMVTGRPPFRGPDALSVAMQHHHGAPAAPSTLRRTLPPEWDELILRLLSKDPDQRPANAVELCMAVASLPCPDLSKRDAPQATVATSTRADAESSSSSTQAAGSGPMLRFIPALAAVLVLLLSAGVVLLQGLRGHTSFADGSPQKAVATYFTLLQAGKVDDAFQLTTTAEERNAQSERQLFHSAFDPWHGQAHGVSLLSTRTSKNVAWVTVEISTFDGNAFGDADTTSRRIVSLVHSHGRWRIKNPALDLP